MRRYKKGVAGFMAAAVLLQGTVPAMAQMPEIRSNSAIMDLSGAADDLAADGRIQMPALPAAGGGKET